MNMPLPVVEASGLRKRFTTALAVDDLDLKIASGEILALLGPTGAGKTTTVRMLVGILRPDSGSITYRLGGGHGASARRWPGYATRRPAARHPACNCCGRRHDAGPLPGGLGGPELVLSMLFAAAGFAFWFTVFAGLDSPDVLWMRILSFLPGVSPSAMPVRILRGDPGIWEVVISMLLLVTGAMALRWAARRVFGLSMLMTGKEPGGREVWRWLRES